MIQKVEMYSIVCDVCREQYMDEHTGFMAMNDKGSIQELAINDEWYEDEKKHYCPKCYEIDDDDNLILK